MAWITVAGLAGKVYVPNATGRPQKKHACKTCYSCQWCDENRCRVCRSDDHLQKETLSQCCCGGKQRSCISSPKSQAPNLE